MKLRRAATPAPILISDTTQGLPYSKGLLASSMMVAGVAPAQAYRVAERVEQVLVERGARQISGTELRDLAATLLAEADQTHARDYLDWQAVEELDQPLVILIGGATGVGKSTIATQLAARLGITRVTSTDAIREVLRSALSEELMPSLFVSSFNADAAVRVRSISSPAEQLIVGFQEQVTEVSVGIKALISRALEEGTDIIVEGAHVVPGFLDGWEEEFAQAVLVPVVVAVSDAEVHRTHFELRALETRARPRDRYLAHFDKIRALQAYIIKQAERTGTPVVEMFDLDSALQRVAALVMTKALERAKIHKEAEAAPARVAAPDAADSVAPAHASGRRSRGGLSATRRVAKAGRLGAWEPIGARKRG